MRISKINVRSRGGQGIKSRSDWKRGERSQEGTMEGNADALGISKYVEESVPSDWPGLHAIWKSHAHSQKEDHPCASN